MVCRLCSGNDLKEVEIRGNSYYLCQNCKLIFIDKKYRPTPFKEKQIYDQHDNALENQGYVNMFEDFINKINLKDKDISAILDRGSGPGPVLAHILKDYGYKVDIYDPYYSPKKIYKNKKYSLITSTEVFEHFQNPYKSISTIYNHIAKNGWLAIMTNMHSNNIEEIKDWRYTRDVTHIAFYSTKTFEYIASKFDMSLDFNDNDKVVLLQKN